MGCPSDVHVKSTFVPEIPKVIRRSGIERGLPLHAQLTQAVRQMNTSVVLRVKSSTKKKRIEGRQKGKKEEKDDGE